MLFQPRSKKFPENPSNRGKKSRAQKKRRYGVSSVSSPLRANTSARLSQRDRSPIVKPVFDARPKTIEASKCTRLETNIQRPQPRSTRPCPTLSLPLSLSACAFVPFLSGAATLPRANPFDSSTKARRLFANHVHATDRKDHERLACIHVNVPPPNLQPFLRDHSVPRGRS